MTSQLTYVSNEVLISRLKSFRGTENSTIADIIHHLSEIDTRKLYLDLGYSSLFIYCKESLGYSEGAAYTRVQGARILKSHPEIYEMIKFGRISICSVAEIAKVADEGKRREILLSSEGKTKRKVEKMTARFLPPENAKKDRIRAKMIEVVTELFDVKAGVDAGVPKKGKIDEALTSGMDVGAVSNGMNAEGLEYGDAGSLRKEIDTGVLMNGTDDHSGWESSEVKDTFEEARSLKRKEMVYSFSIEVDCEFMRLYEEAKEVIGHVTAREVFRRALGEFVNKRKVIKRKSKTSGEKNSRFIPKGLKMEIFKRDNHQCAFVARNGKRCLERHGLEIDHIRPFAVGGSNERENLRLLCPAHNRLMAIRYFGKEKVESFVV